MLFAMVAAVTPQFREVMKFIGAERVSRNISMTIGSFFSRAPHSSWFQHHVHMLNATSMCMLCVLNVKCAMRSLQEPGECALSRYYNITAVTSTTVTV